MSTATTTLLATPDNAAMQAQASQPEQSNWLWELAKTKATDEDEGFYLKYTLLSIAYWCMITLVIHLICMRYNEKYRNEDVKGRALYRSYICSPIHAMTACFLATIAMFFICGGNKTVFNDNECLNTVRYIHIWALLHSTGYFIHDLYVQWVEVGGTSPIDYQTYAHHIIAAGTFYQTLYFMNFMVVFGVMLLFTEISTTYVAMRWLLYKHDMGSSRTYGANAVFMFIFFLFGRLIYQTYIVFWIAIPINYQ